jgi:hypothetical protein
MNREAKKQKSPSEQVRRAAIWDKNSRMDSTNLSILQINAGWN